jgi:transcriptional regulator with XRE-family HTH domain
MALGQSVRAGRKRLRLSQAALAGRVAVHQSQVSRIESGKGSGAALDLWIRIGIALGQPLAVSFSRPFGESRQPIDAGHLEMQEGLMKLARTTGRTATFELPTRPVDPSRSIDVCVRDARARVLIIEEAWNTFGDLGAAIRAIHRKTAEAEDLAATIDDGPPYRVAVVWVVRESAANRSIVNRYPEIVRSAFPGSSRAWARALTSGDPPPLATGFVWFDSATGRIHASRRPTSALDSSRKAVRATEPALRQHSNHSGDGHIDEIA